jgi:SAM-dependent methyltransferase
LDKDPAKDFAAIADDYAFFESHSTEAEEDVRAHLKHVAEIGPGEGAIRMLDFGCGTGEFTAQFLAAVGWPAEQLRLTLVDPAEAVRREAVVRLARFTDAPITVSSAIPAGIAGSCDVVLANHVFYYVPNLVEHLRQLIEALAPGGVLLIAMAGRNNAMFEFWTTGFGQLGREIPYNTSEDLEVALRTLGANYEKEIVPYDVEFPDSEQNRLRLIRFLLADHVADLQLGPLVALFDQFSHDDRIEMRTACEHFTLRR